MTIQVRYDLLIDGDLVTVGSTFVYRTSAITDYVQGVFMEKEHEIEVVATTCVEADTVLALVSVVTKKGKLYYYVVGDEPLQVNGEYPKSIVHRPISAHNYKEALTEYHGQVLRHI